jgi:hypothetical protein
MPKNRVIFAALLLAAPMLCAQATGTHEAGTRKAAIKAAPAHNAAQSGNVSQPVFDPLQLTITFKRTRGDKTSTQKIYTLTASPQQSDPQIRDDRRVPVKKDGPDTGPAPQYFNNNTDVDVQNIRQMGEIVSLTLRISTDRISEGAPAELPTAYSTLSSDRYILSPTAPIGKLTTVYSMEDDVNNYTVEVQLLIRRFNEK